jgi:hypothetical protein
MAELKVIFQMPWLLKPSNANCGSSRGVPIASSPTYTPLGPAAPMPAC